jgi:hypothetical protein
MVIISLAYETGIFKFPARIRDAFIRNIGLLADKLLIGVSLFTLGLASAFMSMDRPAHAAEGIANPTQVVESTAKSPEQSFDEKKKFINGILDKSEESSLTGKLEDANIFTREAEKLAGDDSYLLDIIAFRYFNVHDFSKMKYYLTQSNNFVPEPEKGQYEIAQHKYVINYWIAFCEIMLGGLDKNDLPKTEKTLKRIASVSKYDFTDRSRLLHMLLLSSKKMGTAQEIKGMEDRWRRSLVGEDRYKTEPAKYDSLFALCEQADKELAEYDNHMAVNEKGLAEERLDRALSKFRVVIEKDNLPQYSPALTGIGKALKMKGDNAEAKKYLGKALNITPTDFETNLAMGFCFSQEKDYKRAERQFEIANRLMPGSADEGLKELHKVYAPK